GGCLEKRDAEVLDLAIHSRNAPVWPSSTDQVHAACGRRWNRNDGMITRIGRKFLLAVMSRLRPAQWAEPGPDSTDRVAAKGSHPFSVPPARLFASAPSQREHASLP